VGDAVARSAGRCLVSGGRPCHAVRARCGRCGLRERYAHGCCAGQAHCQYFH